MRFEFPVQATDATVVPRKEEVLREPTITLNAEGCFYVLPTSAIVNQRTTRDGRVRGVGS